MNEITALALGCLVICSGLLNAQDLAYVTADNGLAVREQPKPDARRLGKLNFGEVIEITASTAITHVITDEGETLNGEWVKIESPSLTGYVFNGFLSTTPARQPLELRDKGLRLRLKNLNTKNEFRIHSLHQNDTLNIDVSEGETPEGKLITLQNSAYKQISLFQSHENSVSIVNEESRCNLSGWAHHNSSWTPIQSISESKFKLHSYNQEERTQFKDIDIDALKAYVKEHCGEEWFAQSKDLKTINEYPANIRISRIFLKIILTDKHNSVKQKIVVFNLPSD